MGSCGHPATRVPFLSAWYTSNGQLASPESQVGRGLRCGNRLSIQTWSPHPLVLPPSQSLHLQVPESALLRVGVYGGRERPGALGFPLQSFPRAHLLRKGRLSLAETQTPLKSHRSLPSRGPERLPASGRAPSGSAPISCAASGQRRPLLEAEEASLHLATPAAAAAALPQRDTCRGHQASASWRPSGEAPGARTGSRLLDAVFGEAWETGSETAGDRPKVTQEFPLQLWAPPAYGAIHPSLRQSGCGAHVAQGPGGNPTPPFPPVTSPGAAPSGRREAPPSARAPQDLGLSRLHPHPRNSTPLAAPPRRTLGPADRADRVEEPGGGVRSPRPRTRSRGAVRSERRRSQVGG